MDLGGMFSYSDLVEFTAKFRLEHGLRGYDWHDFTDEGLERLGRPELKEGLTRKDLLWAIYPSDADIDAVGVRGLYLSNFLDWDANAHVRLVIERYGWRPAQQSFERTYRTMSNLDDMHENGIHDYLKFIKLGYGRASDHASKDIRAGVMTREQGIENGAPVRSRQTEARPRSMAGVCRHGRTGVRSRMRYVSGPARLARRSRPVGQGQHLGRHVFVRSGRAAGRQRQRACAALRRAAPRRHSPETEIRPDHLRASQQERFDRDVARLKRRRREFVHVHARRAAKTTAAVDYGSTV
jgi:hypothetical protein